MTEKKTTAKRERPQAKKKEPEVEVKEAIEEPKPNAIIKIPVSPDDSMALSRDVEDQYRLIAMPTPKKFIKKRRGKAGMDYDYVEANYVQLRLNAIFHFDWDFEVLEHIIDRDKDMVAIMGKLTVRFADGRTVHKTAWGGSDLKYLTKWDDHSRQKVKTNRLLDLGADLKSAESDAIKKCASMLGICWDVYAGYGQQEIQEPIIEQDEEEEAEPTDTIHEAEIVAPEPLDSVEQHTIVEEEPAIEEPEEPEPIGEEEAKDIQANEARQAIKDYVRNQLEVLFGKRGVEASYKSVKLFLYDWQETKLKPDGKTPRKFVDLNQWNNLSLMLGDLEDLRLIKENFKYVLDEWKKWVNTSDSIPF